MAEDQPVPGASEPRGLGGWLILVAAQLVLSDLVCLGQVVRSVGAAIAAAQGHDGVPPVIDALFGWPTLFVITLTLLLWRGLRKSKQARDLATAYYAVISAAIVVYWIGYAGGYDWAGHGTVPHTAFPIAIALAVHLGLLAYVCVSRRVKNTFVTESGAKEPEGLRGWLLLPLLVMIFFGLILAYGLEMHDTLQRMTSKLAQGRWLALLRQILVVCFTIYNWLAIVSVFRKKRYAKWMMMAYFAILVAIGLGWLLHPQQADQQSAALVIFIAVGCAIYLLLSKRVKNTFVR